MAEQRQALEGIHVIDFGVVGVGPLHAKILGDFGATVVRVETHTRPEIQRLSRPYKDNVPNINHSGLYSTFNSSKLSLSLDVSKPKGKEVAIRLIKWADVLTQGMTAGTMKKLGLDYDSVREFKPDIVYLSTSQMGSTGPRARFAGFGFHASALAGIFHLDGWPDRAPGGLWGAYTDYIAPYFGVAAILAALDHRRKTGLGQHLDQSQLECAMHFMAPVIMDYTVNGRVLNREGNRLPYAAPHGVYRCRGDDRWIAIAVFTDQEWRALCEVVCAPWVKEARFGTLVGRKENEDELDRLLGEWTADQEAGELMSRLQAASIPSGAVQDTKDLFDDPQLQHRQHIRWLQHSVMGRHSYDGPSFQLSRTPDCQFAAPALGEHNEYICKELLGLSDDEIADLLVEHALTTEDDLPEFRPIT